MTRLEPQSSSSDTQPLAASRILLRPGLTGGRSYIHGADMFDCLASAIAAADMTRLRFIRLSDRPVELRFGDVDHADPSLCGYFESRRSGWLREVPEGPIVEQLPLMDVEAISGAQYDDTSASVVRDPRFTPMKTAVVLGVALLEKTMPDDVLNLGEIEARHPLRHGSRVSVRLARRVAKFIMMSVSLDGEDFGRFTLAATPYVEPASA